MATLRWPAMALALSATTGGSIGQRACSPNQMSRSLQLVQDRIPDGRQTAAMADGNAAIEMIDEKADARGISEVFRETNANFDALLI